MTDFEGEISELRQRRAEQQAAEVTRLKAIRERSDEESRVRYLRKLEGQALTDLPGIFTDDVMDYTRSFLRAMAGLPKPRSSVEIRTSEPSGDFSVREIGASVLRRLSEIPRTLPNHVRGFAIGQVASDKVYLCEDERLRQKSGFAITNDDFKSGCFHSEAVYGSAEGKTSYEGAVEVFVPMELPALLVHLADYNLPK